MCAIWKWKYIMNLIVDLKKKSNLLFVFLAVIVCFQTLWGEFEFCFVIGISGLPYFSDNILKF